jgi:hypothetical protein
MKTKSAVLTIILSLALVPLYAVEIKASVDTSNFAFNTSGDLTPDKSRYGVDVSVSDQLQDNLVGAITFESSPINGSLLGARAKWNTSFLEISAGPSFGMLNSSGSKNDIPVLFQPGIGIGFNISLPGYVTAEADTVFAIPSATASAGQVYLQKSRLAAGIFLPHILCTFAIDQQTNSLDSPTETRIRSITDYGLYTEAYKKGAPLRASINFIYRVSDYYAGVDNDINKKLGNLLLGGGLTWAAQNDFTLFASGSGALYSFSLGKHVDALDKFYFDAKIGAIIHTGTVAAKK